jgi:prepilin-type N-terminal cleavage/methylation domain-containing protein
MNLREKGFTLIELLIVVAIIAILAAIAVPNFLEAQTRSKVSRAKSDQRSLTVALEAYAVDNKNYPPNSVDPINNGCNDVACYILPLSTPIAYITNAWLEDPFGNTDFDFSVFENQTIYFYVNLQGESDQIIFLIVSGALGGNPEAQQAVYSHRYTLASNGPDRVHEVQLMDGDPLNGVSTGDFVNFFATQDDISSVYDPTNGTSSRGDISRTTKGFLEKGYAMP